MIAILLLSCVTPTPPAEVVMEPSVAAGRATHPALRAILEDHWSASMERSPTWATALGDHRFDDRLPDASPEATASWRAAEAGLLARLRAIPDLPPDDAVTADLLAFELAGDLRLGACRGELWDFSAPDNPMTRLADLPEHHPADDPASLVARYRASPAWIDQQVANYRAGLAQGLVVSAPTARLVIDQVDQFLARPDADWPLAAPISAEDAAEVLPPIRASLVAWRAFLADELLPKARPADHEGLWALPGGPECYAALVAQHTSLDLTPEEIHAIGLSELESVHAEFRALGAKVLGTDDLPAIFAALRNPAQRFADEAAVEAKARDTLARANAAVPRVFRVLPKTTCGVEPVPAHLAPFTTIAYYDPSAADGSRPGTYFVNTLDPATRPLHEAEVLAFHESVPGHHLQIALAQEQADLPAFRRNIGCTAFVEGWALYTERLADELGLYSSDLDRLGMLSFDAWRGSRLVVDTGIHHLKWSREDAEKFLLENTPLAENNVRNEVDRYINMPGQALAYKLGQREIFALRREAEEKLGPKFDIAGFHEVVLAAGAVTLPVLRARVEAWIAAR
jgi:uncharacterized protein (DUF885 family)